MRGVSVAISSLGNALFDARGSQSVKIQLQLLVLPPARKLFEHQTRLNIPTVLVLARTALAHLANDFLVSDLTDLYTWIDPYGLNRVKLDGPVSAIAYASKAR
jgi:hypothetical protein